ncbi:hypothetical protein A3K82_01925 [Candidatus Pacearchaeota archaeon RBG_19FT_COMBO_34_9]|nr:MAG: hypothetical protein A3K82_01925 [Candidatus Pacearchaeota archaeon RBG_19FT_COMBO_34_9]OGJ16739.1 MAG: hypothetical protein A3K74_00795 [Candidatus Pacearchaeota archaeon RBG_13_33_26]
MQLICSLELGISPAYLNLETRTGKEICENMTIYSDRNIDIIIKDRWTEAGKSRELKDYNLSAEDMGIKIIFPERIHVSANKKENIKICFSGEKEGIFYGAVLFDSEGGYATIGSWISLNVTEGEKKNFISLTGMTIGAKKSISYIMSGLSVALLIVLIVLLLKLKNKRKKE